MEDVLFEIGPFLGHEVGVLPVTLEQIIHFRFDNLLDMRFLDIVRRDIKADPQGSHHDNAEYCKRQRNAEAKATLKSGHVSPVDSQDHERFQWGHTRLRGSAPGAAHACGSARYRWFPAHPPTLPIQAPCG